jgi:hypothetical protein
VNLQVDFDKLAADIGISLPSARGRREVELFVGEPEPLTVEDILLFVNTDEGMRSSAQPQIVKNIRHRHHLLAQLLAGGTPEMDASIQTGYSLSRISILKNDPAFKELLAYYSKQVELANVEFVKRLAQIGTETAEEILKRLDEDPESFSNEEMRKLLETVADRTGHGKTSSVIVSHGLDDETKELIRQQHRPEGKILDLQAATEGEQSEIDTRTEGGHVTLEQAYFYPGESPEEREHESEGSGLSVAVFELHRAAGLPEVQPPNVSDAEGERSEGGAEPVVRFRG